MTAFKIVSTQLWNAQINATGRFIGTELDLQDGFIHLSTEQQVKETAERRFKGLVGLSIICVNLTRVTSEIKWEASRSRKDELFPHIYGFIDMQCVKWIRDFSIELL